MTHPKCVQRAALPLQAAGATLLLMAAIAMSPTRGLAQGTPQAAAERTELQPQEQLDPHLMPAARSFDSPERFILEFRGGPYNPAIKSNPTYGAFFKDDQGPNVAIQIDGIVYRQPNFFYLTVGGGIGFAGLSGQALAQGTSSSVNEETTLAVVPLTALAGVRLDILPRRLHIPVIFGARIGWEWAHWDTNTGKRDDAAGWSLGPVFSGQIAIDLDSFEQGGARNLDEEWGINHTYLFGEIYHFTTTAKSLELGATSWFLGLGFIF
jgi:hypothetical protein